MWSPQGPQSGKIAVAYIARVVPDMQTTKSIAELYSNWSTTVGLTVFIKCSKMGMPEFADALAQLS